MPTTHEHILADLAYLFGQDGEEVIELLLDGEIVRAIPFALDENDGDFAGQLVYRQRYLFLAAALSPVLGQEKTIDGKPWRVVSIARPTGLIDVTFERQST